MRLEAHRRVRARPDLRQVGADHLADGAADRVGPAGIAARLLLDHPLEQAGREGHAARLDRLQVAGRQQIRRGRVAPVAGAVGEDLGEARRCARPGRARAPPDRRRSSSALMRRRAAAEIDHVVARGSRPGSAPADRPGTHARPTSAAAVALGRQARRRRQMLLHVASRSFAWRRAQGAISATRREVGPIAPRVASQQADSRSTAACAPM